jgi:hypothetical protein
VCLPSVAYLLPSKTWVGLNREKSYYFQRRMERPAWLLVGFGLELTAVHLQAANKRPAGKHYLAKEAALEVNKKTNKPPPIETPFV